MFNVAMNMILILMMTDLKRIAEACFNIRVHQSHMRTKILKTNCRYLRKVKIPLFSDNFYKIIFSNLRRD